MLARVLAVLVLAPSLLPAQHRPAPGSSPSSAPPAEAAQFDFLVGQWDLTVRVPVSGLAARIHGSPRLAGTWKAWRGLDGWGIDDELRIVDASGNPMSLSRSLRVYDAAARRWSQTTLDAYRARFTAATGEWTAGELIITGSGTDAEGRPYRSRTRFHDITPTSFRYLTERSTDDGRTWSEALRIEARRTAAAAAR